MQIIFTKTDGGATVFQVISQPSDSNPFPSGSAVLPEFSSISANADSNIFNIRVPGNAILPNGQSVLSFPTSAIQKADCTPVLTATGTTDLLTQIIDFFFNVAGGSGESAVDQLKALPSFTNGDVLTASGSDITWAPASGGSLPSPAGHIGQMITTTDGTTASYQYPLDWINVKNYGAVGDGVTDDTAAFVDAITDALTLSSATVFVPEGVYIVSTIDIPAVNLNTSGFCSLTIVGVSTPPSFFGTLGSGYTLTNGGTIIKSNTSSATKGVIYATPDSGTFSALLVSIKNIEIRVPDNPNISGIHAGWASQLMVRDVFINGGKYTNDAAEPTHNTSNGIVTPYINNGALTDLFNVCITGVYSGISTNEHTTADVLNITACIRGLDLQGSNCPIFINRVAIYHTQYPIYVSGPCHFDILQYSGEHNDHTIPANGPAWQDCVNDYYNPLEQGIGTIKYLLSQGTFSKSGGIYSTIANVGAPYPVSYTNGNTTVGTYTGIQLPTGPGLLLPGQPILNLQSSAASTGSNNFGSVYFTTNQPTANSPIATIVAINPAATGDIRSAIIGISTLASTGSSEYTFYNTVAGVVTQSMKISPAGILPPQWSTTGRPSAVAGTMGYNTTDNKMEYYNGSTWIQY